MFSTEKTVIVIGPHSFAAEVLHGEPRVRDQEVSERISVSLARIRDVVRDLTGKGTLRGVVAFLIPKAGRIRSQPEFWFNREQLVVLLSQFDRNRKKPAGKSEVYFIHSPEAEMIKIGFSTDVDQRMESLKTASPFPLQLILSLPGTMQDERNLHRLFDSCRGHGEWFTPHPDLLEFIDSCREIKNSSMRLRDLIKQVESKYK